MINNTVLEKVTAIIMAGGKSARMKSDKLLLPVNGIPLIQHVYNQIKNYFSEILISSNYISNYSFLNVKIVQDKIPGCGPLMGIASAMDSSANDINFVIAGDIPEIDKDLMLSIIEQCRNYDGVIPVNSKNQYEPLFAVYKKSMLSTIFKHLSEGKYKITDCLKNFNIKYMKHKKINRLININDINDYLIKYSFDIIDLNQIGKLIELDKSILNSQNLNYNLARKLRANIYLTIDIFLEKTRFIGDRQYAKAKMIGPSL